MKLAIFTQPLKTNYGGLLQCYALMTILKRLGHSPEVISRVNRSAKNDLYSKYYKYLKHFIWCIKNRSLCPMPTNSNLITISQETSKFINKYINPRSLFIYSNKELEKYIASNDFDGFIAGSDQCWRPMYSPQITNYFFDFAKHLKNNTVRISYAASFGVDSWEFNKAETKKCSSLAKKFNAISVREIAGIDLCTKYLGVNSVLVLDPTMLLEKDDYEKLVVSENENKSLGDLFYYILDNNVQKKELIETIALKFKYTPFTVMAELALTPKNIHQNLDACIFPRVTQWLRAFMDAKMVVTDSFHGCVFSIIFNKPFWVVGNKSRGLSRFESLLKIFGLESRLIDLKQTSHIDFQEPIYWDEVNKKRKKWQEHSLNFLKYNLKA